MDCRLLYLLNPPPAGQENAPKPAQRALQRHLGQENAPKPAQKVPRGSSGQKKVSFPARNGIPPACRAGKCPKTCAEGAPRQFRAGKRLSTCAEGAPRRFRAEIGIFSGAEWDTTRLPGRKMPLNLRRRCSEVIPGRNRHLFRRRMGYPPPTKRITSLCTFRRSIFRSRRR